MKYLLSILFFFVSYFSEAQNHGHIYYINEIKASKDIERMKKYGLNVQISPKLISVDSFPEINTLLQDYKEYINEYYRQINSITFLDTYEFTKLDKRNMKEQKKVNRWFLINQVWLVKNVPFFLYLSALAVIYIYNGHHAEKAIKDINKTSKELKDLQYEYKMVKSEWMFMTKQSEVIKAVTPFGIKEILEPPVLINDTIVDKNVKRN